MQILNKSPHPLQCNINQTLLFYIFIARLLRFLIGIQTQTTLHVFLRRLLPLSRYPLPKIHLSLLTFSYHSMWFLTQLNQSESRQVGCRLTYYYFDFLRYVFIRCLTTTLGFRPSFRFIWCITVMLFLEWFFSFELLLKIELQFLILLVSHRPAELISFNVRDRDPLRPRSFI